MGSSLEEEVNSTIRSVLISAPLTLTVNEVWNDYKHFNGEPIPLRQLGYRTLLEYLRTIPHVVSLDNPNSPYSLVHPVGNKKVQHMVNLVQGQKQSKSLPRHLRNRPRPRTRRDRPEPYVPFEVLESIRKFLEDYPTGIDIEDFEVQVTEIQEEVGTNLRFDDIFAKLSSFCHIREGTICLLPNFNTTSRSQLKNEHHVVVESEDESVEDLIDFLTEEEEEEEERPEPILYGGRDGSRRPSAAGGGRNGTASPRKSSSRRSGHSGESGCLISENLKKNLRALLDENPNGIWAAMLSRKYESKFGYSLNPHQHGFDCVMTLAFALNDIFTPKRFQQEGDFLLKDARVCKANHAEDEEGVIPKSVITEIYKILIKKSNNQIYTDELADEYKKFYKKTLDPPDYGLRNMDALLRSLTEIENAYFCIRTVKGRGAMYLRCDPKNDRLPENLDDALDNIIVSYLPDEVCGDDFQLTVNPLLKHIGKDTKLSVKLAEVYTPERFYVHFSENMSDLQVMMDELHQFYTHNGDDYNVLHDTVRRGLLCVCPFSGDSKWHRVQIVQSKGPTHVKVRFFDYGTTEEVPICRLRYLHKDFADLPAMSVRAKLNGIRPKRPTSAPDESPKYTSEVNEFFFHLVSGKDLEAKILDADLTHQSLDVFLYCKDENGRMKAIHEELLKAELVESKEPAVQNEPKPVTRMKYTPAAKGKIGTTAAAAAPPPPLVNTNEPSSSKKNRPLPPPGLPPPPPPPLFQPYPAVNAGAAPPFYPIIPKTFLPPPMPMSMPMPLLQPNLNPTASPFIPFNMQARPAPPNTPLGTTMTYTGQPTTVQLNPFEYLFVSNTPAAGVAGGGGGAMLPNGVTLNSTSLKPPPGLHRPATAGFFHGPPLSAVVAAASTAIPPPGFSLNGYPYTSSASTMAQPPPPPPPSYCLCSDCIVTPSVTISTASAAAAAAPVAATTPAARTNGLSSASAAKVSTGSTEIDSTLDTIRKLLQDNPEVDAKITELLKNVALDSATAAPTVTSATETKRNNVSEGTPSMMDSSNSAHFDKKAQNRLNGLAVITPPPPVIGRQPSFTITTNRSPSSSGSSPTNASSKDNTQLNKLREFVKEQSKNLNQKKGKEYD